MLLARFSHWDDRHYIALFHDFSNFVRVIAMIDQKNAWRGQIIHHDLAKPIAIRNLLGRDLRPHSQACGIDEEVDLGREATS